MSTWNFSKDCFGMQSASLTAEIPEEVEAVIGVASRIWKLF